MKKHSERRKYCALAVLRRSQKFSPRPAGRPAPREGAKNGQNLISWRWSLYLYLQTKFWWKSMHAISRYPGNRPTNTQTNKTDYNTLHR